MNYFRFLVSAALCLAASFLFVSASNAADPYVPLLKNVRDSEQVIIAEGSPGSHKATVKLYEKTGSKWQLKRISPAVTGKNGISFLKKEGDGATPAGTYSIGRMFGFAAKPDGVRSSYTATNRFHYWIDDPASADYNKWVYYRGNPDKRWKSYERLNHFLYKYAVVIRYNENPIVKNAGSAIFIHRWKNSASPTAGCLALSESHLLVLMKWINPVKQPKIIIGTPNSIAKKLAITKAS